MTGTRGKSNKLVLNDFLCGKSTFITVIFFFFQEVALFGLLYS